MSAVSDGRNESGSNNADKNKKCSRNTCLILGKAIWLENLVKQRRQSIEEADLN